MGQGPMTGRGMGACGCGTGWGRRLGRMFGLNYRQPTAKDLEDEKVYLEDELTAIKEEIKQLKK